MQETMSRLNPEAAYFGPEASGQLSSSSICRTPQSCPRSPNRSSRPSAPPSCSFPVMNQEDLEKGPPAVGVVLSVATKLGSHCEWRTLDAVRMFQGAWLAVSEAYVRSEEDLGREQPVAG